jgi:RNA polymerase sigma factor (sigma-70 family)
MTETAWSALRQMLVHRYGELCAQLARRLNSEELAREALHDTWLHLRQKQGSEGIHNPAGYLLRTAFNIAIDERRRAARSARWIEVDGFLDAADDSPGPARIVEAQQDMELLRQALEELTPRRRLILLASRVEGTPLRQIAEDLGLSRRMVDMELRRALRHCATRLRRAGK